MKKLLFALFLLPLLGFAADSTIHGLPTRATPAGSDYTVVDYQVGPAWFNGKVSLYSLRDYIGGTSGYPTTNMYVTYLDVDYITNITSWTTNLYATTEYVTNLFATYETNLYSYTTNLYATTEYVTNLFSTYETNLYSYTTNLYATTEYVTNLYATTSYITNLYVEYFTNNYSYITNLYTTNITANRVYVTENITYVAATPTTNAWSGPSNTIPLHLADLNYLAYTPCEIQGVTSKSNTVAQHSLLTMLNSSGSNITITLNAAIRSGDYARTYTLSNNAVGVFSVGYTPALGGLTNLVYRDFN